MEELRSLIKAISNGAKNPWLTIIGVVFSILGCILWGAWKEKLRRAKAEVEKEKDKVKDQDELEQSNEEADASARDRLENRT